MFARVSRVAQRCAVPSVPCRFISVGEQVPSVTEGLKLVKGDAVADVTTNDLFKGRKVVLFGLPGAFTPVCSGNHVPGFIAKADEIRSKGVDEIVCVTPNDWFVTKAWAKDQGTDDKVSLLADGNRSLIRALDMEEDMRWNGMDLRSNRFAMIIEDGKVTKINAEKSSGEFTVSSAESVLKEL